MPSYIITHRGSSNHRLKNLKLVLDWLSSFSFEVIVVEEDNEPKVESLVNSYKYKYIFAYNNSVFNKSWGMNIGIKSSNENIVFCGDNDMVLREKDILRVIENVDPSLDSFKPYSDLIDLTNIQTIIYEKYNRILSLSLNKRKFACYCSGITAFTRRCLEDVGGWDERFHGWGAEDDAISVKLVKLGKSTSIYQNSCFHLYHSRSMFDTNKHTQYEDNLRLLKEIEGMSDIKGIIFPLSKLGDINKYISY